jgi:parallel beta-helix repeat protein
MLTVKKNRLIVGFFFFQFFFGPANGRVQNSVIPIDDLKSSVSSAISGDTLYIKSGEYKDKRITLNYSGADKIFILPEKPGTVTLTGNSTIIFEKSRNVVFSGINFDEIQNPSSVIIFASSEIEISQNTFYKCGRNPFHTIVRVDNGSFYNVISDNIFDGSLAMSVVIILRDENDFSNTNNIIKKNTFRNIPAVTSVYEEHRNGLEAIQLGQGSHSEVKLFTEVFENYFENVTGDGSEIISSKSSNNRIFDNVFKNNNSGITLRSGDNVEVFNNYLENTSQGIRIFGSGHKIYNNYIVNADIAIQIPSTDIKFGTISESVGYNQQANVEVKGNYIISKGDRSAFSIGDERMEIDPTNLSIRNNHIYLEGSAREFQIRKGTDLTGVKLRRNRTYRPASDQVFLGKSRFNRREMKYFDLDEGSSSIPSPHKVLTNPIMKNL